MMEVLFHLGVIYFHVNWLVPSQEKSDYPFHVKSMNYTDDVNLGEVRKSHCFPKTLIYSCILTNHHFVSVFNLDSPEQRWPIVSPGLLPQVLLSQGSSSESPYRGSSGSPPLTFSVAAPGRPSSWCALSWNDCEPCSWSRRLLLVLPLPSSALLAFTAATTLFQRLQDPLSFLLRKREEKNKQTTKPFVLKAHTHTWISLGFTQLFSPEAEMKGPLSHSLLVPR